MPELFSQSLGRTRQHCQKCWPCRCRPIRRYMILDAAQLATPAMGDAVIAKNCCAEKFRVNKLRMQRCVTHRRFRLPEGYCSQRATTNFDFCQGVCCRSSARSTELDMGRLSARTLAEHGVVGKLLTSDEVRTLEPALTRSAVRSSGALHMPVDGSGDSFTLVNQLRDVSRSAWSAQQIPHTRHDAAYRRRWRVWCADCRRHHPGRCVCRGTRLPCAHAACAAWEFLGLPVYPRRDIPSPYRCATGRQRHGQAAIMDRATTR